MVQGQSETLCFKNITIASRNQTGFFIGKGDDIMSNSSTNNFSFGFGNIFGSEYAFDAPKPKKEEKKPAATKAAKKGKTATSKPISVTLPVTVISNSFKVEVEGEGTITTDELSEKLYEMGYEEISSKFRNMVVMDNIVYVVHNTTVVAPDEETLVAFEEDKPVIFAYGMKKQEFTKADFSSDDDEEEVEITVGDLKEKILASMPEFNGFVFAYDIESATVVVNYSEADRVMNTAKISGPVTFNVFGDDIAVDDAETVGNALEREIYKELSLSESSDVKVEVFKTLEAGCYYLRLRTFKGKTASASDKLKTAKGKSTAKKEEKYHLPCHVYMAMNGYRGELTSEMFGGKEKITKEDIKSYFADETNGLNFLDFRSAEKSGALNFEFEKVTNTVNISRTGAKRGAYHNAAWDYEETERYVPAPPCKVIDTMEEYLERVMRPGILSSNYEIGASLPNAGCRLYSNHAISYLYKVDEYHIETLQDVFLKIPRIPKRILNEVIDYFKQDLSKEAVCQIEYDLKKKEYFMVKPLTAVVGKTFVKDFKFPVHSERDIICVIHSHNDMIGSFSTTDNRAEKDEIGLFGVIGELDSDNPSMSFRAAYQGSPFLTMPKEFLFQC